MKRVQTQLLIARMSANPTYQVKRPLISIHYLHSRERHELRISRNTIRANAILLEPLLDIYFPRFVKTDTSDLHQSLHFPLGRLIETTSAVTLHDVGGEVEVRGCETTLDVAHEGGWKAAICEVAGTEAGESILNALGDVRCPAGAGVIEN